MAKLIIDKELKKQLQEAFRKLDDELKGIEEIYDMADKELYEIEKRIARLRRTHRA